VEKLKRSRSRNGSSFRFIFNLFLFLFVTLIVAAAGSTIYLGYIRAMAYVHPKRAQPASKAVLDRLNVDYQPINLLTEDGITLKGWYVPSKNGTVILLAHGFPGRRSEKLMAMFARHGYGVVAWDFRAQGESEGNLCTMGYYETLDVKAALDFARKQPEVRHIGGLGESMGGATMIHAAARWNAIEAIVADSAFTGLDDMLQAAIPYPPLRPFIQFFAERETGISLHDMRPVDDISKLSPRPVFIIQGDHDSLVPPSSAQALYNAAGEPRRIWIGEGMEHVAMFSSMPAEYERRVMDFFNSAFH
jgi:uncharacterized protein